MDDSKSRRQLPQWQSHKKVWAAKIESVESRSEPPRLYLEGGFRVDVTGEWLGRHAPSDAESADALVGGYYVRYTDSYESWSPAEAFEEGYMRIRDDGTD